MELPLRHLLVVLCTAIQPMQKINGVAEDGTAYNATSSLNAKLTNQTGRDIDVRGLIKLFVL